MWMAFAEFVVLSTVLFFKLVFLTASITLVFFTFDNGAHFIAAKTPKKIKEDLSSKTLSSQNK